MREPLMVETSNKSSTFFFMAHIGQLIREELKQQGRTVTWLAKAINCDRTNIYNIFARESIDTSLLTRISKALNRNFFEILTEELNSDPKASK